MYLMAFVDEATGKIIYTLKKASPDGKPTDSAHPARFSPDDKFSRVRASAAPGLRRAQPLATALRALGVGERAAAPSRAAAPPDKQLTRGRAGARDVQEALRAAADAEAGLHVLGRNRQRRETSPSAG